MVTSKKVTRKKVSVPSDVSQVVLEYHAKNLGMSLDELISRLNSMPGTSTAEKLRQLYKEFQEKRKSERPKAQEFALGRVYPQTVRELEGQPGKYMMAADILNPSAENEEEMFLPGLIPVEGGKLRRYVTIFAWEQTKDRLLTAPLGATITGVIRYDEEYDSWTLSAFRVYPPKQEYLDMLCDAEATEIDWSQFDPRDRGSTVYFWIDPNKFDVDPTFKETRDGSPVVKAVAPYRDGFLVLNVFDTEHLPGDPWTEWKSYPKVYAMGRLYRVRDNQYIVSVNRVYVPTEVEEPTKESIADKVAEILKKKPKKVSTISAVARALGVSEADVLAAIQDDERFEVDEDGVITLLEG